jgi:hypothetical protein
MAGVRAIISQGWSDLGTETKETASDIHFVGDPSSRLSLLCLSKLCYLQQQWNQIPHQSVADHFRAPTLIPKPEDWGSHISIAGFFFLPTASTYVPPPRLATFLENGQIGC